MVFPKPCFAGLRYEGEKLLFLGSDWVLAVEGVMAPLGDKSEKGGSIKHMDTLKDWVKGAA